MKSVFISQTKMPDKVYLRPCAHNNLVRILSLAARDRFSQTNVYEP